MTSYTLHPEKDHGVPKKEVFKQFLFFVQQLRKNNIFELNGKEDLKQAVKAMKRWGALEGGTLANAARRHPDRLGLIDDDGELTYSEFLEKVVSLANGLQNRGVKNGGNVAVMALNGRAAIFPLCARQMLGYHIFMINANSSGPQIEKVLDFHEVDTLIVDQEFYERLTPKTKDSCRIIIGYVDDEAAVPAGVETMAQVIASAEPNPDTLPDKPTKSQHVVMTSGTTGMPKGVVRRQLKSPQGIAPALASIPWRQNLTVILTGVLFHFYGWANLLLCMLTNSTIITHRKFDAQKALDDIHTYKVNAWVASASRLRNMFTYMDQEGIDREDGLEFILSSGSPLTPFEVQKVTEKFGPVLHNSYGSTETAALAISARGELPKNPTLTGTIYPGYKVEIRDDEGNLLPDGEVGDIYAGCYDMFAGYTDPSIKVPTIGGLLRMGDRGYREGNRLYVKGRADDLVITQFGEKIFPSELEDLLIRDDRIDDVHVHGVKDPKYGQALRCYVIRDEKASPADLTEDDVREIVVNALSDAHAPRDVFFVKDFPRNPMGKVIRPELPDHSTA